MSEQHSRDVKDDSTDMMDSLATSSYIVGRCLIELSGGGPLYILIIINTSLLYRK